MKSTTRSLLAPEPTAAEFYEALDFWRNLELDELHDMWRSPITCARYGVSPTISFRKFVVLSARELARESEYESNTYAA